jgi:hypothetical protein
MTNKRPSTERIIKAKNSYVEGSPKLEKGDFVGGNKISGMSSKDVIKLIETINETFAPKYVNPEYFAQALNKFKEYHEALLEWKELHNAINEILGAFDPFQSSIQRLTYTPRKAIPKDLRANWFPVRIKINELIKFSRNIKIIGEPFQEFNGQSKGESWAIDFHNIEKEMEGILEVAILSGNPFIGSPDWWNKLVELSGIINHTILNHLYVGDKKLRETATDLYNLSEKVFQRQ